MEATDYAKLIYQSAFAGGHLIASRENALAWLEREIASLPENDSSPLTESIGGGLSRLYLAPARAMGLRPETVIGLFIETSVSFEKDPVLFQSGMKELESLCREGAIDADADEVASLCRACCEQGYPPFSHSERYRAAYAPAYRLVSDQLCAFLDVFAAIDVLLMRQGHARVAIDGCCASGKTTAAGLIRRVYDAQLFHMDDYFLPFERKTPERLAQPGGNVDYERFQAEILDHLNEDSFSYRPYDCQTGDLAQPVQTEKRPVQIIEGVYCLHPEMKGDYDLRVFMDINPELKRERLLARNPDKYDRFVNEWIPLEDHYFEACDIASSCDLIHRT